MVAKRPVDATPVAVECQKQCTDDANNIGAFDKPLFDEPLADSWLQKQQCCFFVEAVTGCAHKRLSLAPMSTLGRQAGSLAKLAH